MTAATPTRPPTGWSSPECRKTGSRTGASYEYFEGRDAMNGPAWTDDIARRGAVFTARGRCYRSGISFNAGLKRYLWCQILPGDDPQISRRVRHL